MPSGSGGTVIDVRVFNRHGIEKDERSITIERAEIDLVQQDKIVEEEILDRSIKQRALQILQGFKPSKKIKNLPAGEEINQDNILSIPVSDLFKIEMDNQKNKEILVKLKDQFEKANQDIKERFEDKVLKIRQGDDLLPSVMKMVKVFAVSYTHLTLPTTPYE